MSTFLIFAVGFVSALVLRATYYNLKAEPHQHSIQLDDETTITIIHSHKQGGRYLDLERRKHSIAGVFIPYSDKE